MKNWVLVNNYGKSNTSDKIYYTMDYSDLPNLTADETVLFGDKAYVIKKGDMAFFGNDGNWYDSDGNQI